MTPNKTSKTCPGQQFASALRKLMFQKDVSEKQLAAATGATRDAVAYWKKGSIPNGYKVFLIARFFGVQESSFFHEPIDFQI
ncbi:MAG TPA: helix-turn-helix transcriptional regulator [Verrucomicrobiae bacterium]|nr:helix-turn-helix transcriptional regulator [Verrucomicrobiae bacterium]